VSVRVGAFGHRGASRRGNELRTTCPRTQDYLSEGVELGSFRAASRALGVPKPTVSRWFIDL
jgi:hypothetical protein